jgi:phenylacetate-CoA ligase
MMSVHKDLANPLYVEWVDFLSRTDGWDIEAINRHQLAEVRRIVQHAFQHTAGYRELFLSHGVTPEDIRDVRDLSRFPFTSKTTFRDRVEEFSFKSPGSSYITTGGSTGVPMGMYRDYAAFSKELASKAHQYHRVGWREGQRQVVFRGLKIDSVDSTEFVSEFNELRCSTYEFGSELMETYLAKAKSYGPEWIRCYPSSGYVFARYLNDTGQSLEGLKGMLCSSEQLYPFQKELFKKVFGDISIFCHYGHYEMAALAGFCEYTDDYHVLPQYGYVELLDKNDEPVTRPGEVGEIVATSFIMTATPFVRYRTQDLAVYKGMGCEKCGRPYQIWERVEGRLQELIVTLKGRVISTSMLNMHDDTYDRIEQFQFHQRERGKLMFKYIAKPGTDPSVGSGIYTKMKEKLGEDIELEMRRVDHIPLTKRGKHMLLVQEIDLSYHHPSLEVPLSI